VCVAYARSRVAFNFPSNLYTWKQKQAIRNTTTCKKGYVAIINNGRSDGHLAVVEDCDSSGSSQSITITETNWKTGYLTKRTSKTSKISKSESELGIYGYRKP
jgi:surface antigen